MDGKYEDVDLSAMLGFLLWVSAEGRDRPLPTEEDAVVIAHDIIVLLALAGWHLAPMDDDAMLPEENGYLPLFQDEGA